MKRSLISSTLCLLIIIAASVISTLAQQPVRDLKPTVILISLDGFRYDYLDKYKPVTLNRLAAEGVRAKWMIPSFPTKTFPHHYTIATGLYPEHHGIVENNVWDFGTTFTLAKREEVQNPRWWLGEPIWVTAEKQGVRAGAYFFPGTETEIAGVRPSIWKPYDGKVKNEDRVDTVLSWFDMPSATRPQMITMYFSDTDDAGHAHSPDSEEVQKAVERLDNAIARLMAGLNARKIAEKVNIVIVSDHGMAKVPSDHAIMMDDYFDREKTAHVLTTGEIWQIFPKDGQTDLIMSGLAKLQHAICWRKSNIPARLHYSEGSRIAPIVCSAEEGWYMTSQKRTQPPAETRVFGAHGYDNKYQEMMATFIAHGDKFRRHMVAEPFPNVDVYELMCAVLRLRPARNDGNFDEVKGMLR